MLDFGIQKVIWILAKTPEIMFISAGQDWDVSGFYRDIPLLDECVLNLAQLLAEEGMKY